MPLASSTHAIIRVVRLLNPRRMVTAPQQRQDSYRRIVRPRLVSPGDAAAMYTRGTAARHMYRTTWTRGPARVSSRSRYVVATGYLPRDADVSCLSRWRRRDDRRSAGWRLHRGARARSPHVNALGRVASRAPGRDRSDQREATAAGRPRRRIGAIDDDAVAEDAGQHLVLDELRDDAAVEGWRIDLAPVL